MSWGRDTAVQCFAITGIAASSLGGKTIASVLAMKNSFSADMLATKLLVIDEVRYCIIVINNILGLIYFLKIGVLFFEFRTPSVAAFKINCMRKFSFSCRSHVSRFALDGSLCLITFKVDVFKTFRTTGAK